MDAMPLGPLLLFAAAMCFTPGPNVIMVVASAANFGFRRAVPHMLGITIGFGLMIMVIGLGLAGLIQAAPRLHLLFNYAGAAYLLYLAWRIARADDMRAAAARARPISFIEATLFQWINPKGWATALGALATFTSGENHVLPETLAITTVLAAACFLSVVLWAGFGAAVARFIRRPAARRGFNCAMAGLLVLSLIPVIR